MAINSRGVTAREELIKEQEGAKEAKKGVLFLEKFKIIKDIKIREETQIRTENMETLPIKPLEGEKSTNLNIDFRIYINSSLKLNLVEFKIFYWKTLYFV